MTITEATPKDWQDFWENEMPTSPSFNQEQLTALLSLSEQIQENIVRNIDRKLWTKQFKTAQNTSLKPP